MGRRSLEWEQMQARRDAVCPVLRAGASLPPHTKKGPPLAIKHRPLTLFLITIKELHQPPEDHPDPSSQMVLTRLGSARATKPAPA